MSAVPAGRRPCVFFDRDGIVNVSPGPGRYVEKEEDFHLIEGFVRALAVARDKGYEAVIVTNQRGVSRGRMTLATVVAIHRSLEGSLKSRGLALRDILVCTDLEEHAPRRKPNPGMLLEAAEKHHLDLAASWMVGDQERDVEAGRRAGCRTVFVGSAPPPAADYAVADMDQLAAFLDKHLGRPRPKV